MPLSSKDCLSHSAAVESFLAVFGLVTHFLPAVSPTAGLLQRCTCVGTAPAVPATMLHLRHHCPCELAGLGVHHCSLFAHTGSQPPHWRRLRGFLRGRDSRYEAHTIASAHCPTATVSGADPPQDRPTQLFSSLILTHSSTACPHPLCRAAAPKPLPRR